MKRNVLATLVGAALGLAACPDALAQFDTSDSQRVGHLQYGNGLDPSGWAAFAVADPLGMSWLHPGQLRTPSGALYPYPHEIPDSERIGATDWSYFGLVQLGYLSSSGDADHAFFGRYSDWEGGPALGLLFFSATNPGTGSYVEFRGSRISQDDQYYRLRAGRLGSSRFGFFHRVTPHLLGTTAYPLWDGVGSTSLTLPPGIAIGSTQQAVAEVLESRARQTLSVSRRSTGASWEGAATPHWIGYASVTRERRNGQRDWAGPMYLTYFFGGPGVPGTSGGQYETVRPVDFTTTDVQLGMRNKGGAMGWLLDFALTGSFFRDRKDHLDFQVPFPVRPGATSVATGGTFALEPDNDYYNLRLQASHPLDFWKGSVSMSAAWSSMRQDDALQAPLDPAFCPDGMSLGSSGIACSDWNTTDALSRDTARARIDTMLVDLRADFRPAPELSLYAHLRQYDENNKTRYTMFNPLTGQYGYVAENGSVALLIPAPAFLDVFKPGDPRYQSVFAQVANIPSSYDRLKFEAGGSYDLGERGTLGMSYRLEHRTPQLRERSRVDEQFLELDWDGKVLDDATLRVSYEAQRRTGDAYEPNPYLVAFSPSMPGYVSPPAGYTAFTVAQMYKYDLGDLHAGKLKAILVKPVGNDATLTASLHGNRRHYRALIGRQSFDTVGADAAWDWAPSPATTMSAYAGYQSSRLRQGNVNDREALTATPGQVDMEFGGAFFPLANFWSATDDERNINAGAYLRHAFSPRVRLDLGYDFSHSRGVNRYDAASLAALSTVYAGILDAAAIGDRFPTNVYRTHDLTANLDLALTGDIGLRLFCKAQRGHFLDWHYAGFDTPADLVVGNRVFTQLAPPADWNAMAVGAFFTMRL